MTNLTPASEPPGFGMTKALDWNLEWLDSFTFRMTLPWRSVLMSSFELLYNGVIAFWGTPAMSLLRLIFIARPTIGFGDN